MATTTEKDFYESQMTGFHTGRGGSTAYGGQRTKRLTPISDMASLPPRRPINMRKNTTGRSINGGGSQGKSTSPCSQSGMDPNLPRGQSSQLNFDMMASNKQI